MMCVDVQVRGCKVLVVGVDAPGRVYVRLCPHVVSGPILYLTFKPRPPLCRIVLWVVSTLVAIWLQVPH